LVDIHSHFLYGLDDGAKTIEESAAMVQMAGANGTTDLVATPHASPEYQFEPALIRERLEEVESIANGVRLYSGADFHLSYDNIEAAIGEPRKFTINQKRYLLVEFSDLLIFKNTTDIFARLADAGMTPIITHPERNGLLRQRLAEIERWVEEGARVQITGQSLTGLFGRRAKEFCEELLERGMVHFVASDAHDCEYRPPRLDGAFAWISKRYGAALAQALCVTNPKAAVEGELIEAAQQSDPGARKKWYQIWR
jgi:protein-tyrosine phosphatase